MKISIHDLDVATPLPATRGPASGQALSFPVTMPSRTNRLAIAAFVFGILGALLFGVPGLVAVLLGSLAIGPIRANGQRGTILAVSGILLGVFDIVGWIFLVNWMQDRPGRVMPIHDVAPDPSSIKNLPPPLRRAMNANVVIQSGRGFFSGSMGSGVILKVEDGQAYIVTNRHVIDESFGSSTTDDKIPASNATLQVKWIDQISQSASILWVAPRGIDIAILKATFNSKDAEVAIWDPDAQPKIGDQVFAIGNPEGLSWTHTQGVISQFRSRGIDRKDVRVIQTQTALNHGNSGGGLYDQEGKLIGINTWSSDKRVSEGLSFAISWQSVLELKPPGTEPVKTKEKKR